MSVAFRAAGTVYTATASGTTFTLNKPAGVVEGDTMVAMVACWANGSQKTITSTGWTVRQTAYRDVGGDELQLVVFTRVAGASEPASWTATASGSVLLRVAAVSAYSGVQTLGNSGQTTDDAGTSFATATVNNDLDQSWRVTVAACFDDNASTTLTTNETTRRVIGTADVGTGATQAAIWDSNAGIATGNTSRTVSRSASWNVAGSVIILLEPSPGTPAEGTWSSTLAKVTAEGEGEVHDDATVAATLPAVSFDGEGLGQPPEADGDVGATLPAVSSGFEGGTDVIGTLGAIATVTSEVVAETRAFGVRVINVEAEDRTIEVESRAVAD